MGGRSIRIFFIDGIPSGLRTAEIGLSTIRSVYIPRGLLQDFAKRDEAIKTGIYLLLGDDPKVPGRLKIYVGEGDEVVSRLVSHDKDDAKDFWDRAVIFVAKDENLTKAHVRHLEARLIDMAIKAKRSTVDNKTAPNGGTLPEADLADMEEFITQVRLLLATMGIDALDAAGSGPGTGQALPGVKKPEFEELQMAGEGYKATCSVVQGEFVVKEGSRARKMEAASLSPSSKAKRIELLSSGVLQDINEALQFLQDYAFKSASGAAQVICGANVNGRMAWKMGDGATYADWHEASLTVAVPQQAE